MRTGMTRGSLEPCVNPFYVVMPTAKWCVECGAIFDSADHDTCPACANKCNLVNLSDYFREGNLKHAGEVVELPEHAGEVVVLPERKKQSKPRKTHKRIGLVREETAPAQSHCI